MSQTWTTPKHIRSLLQKRWENQQLLKCWLQGELTFPYVISLKKPSTTQLSQRFGDVQDWINTLRSGSSDNKNNSYTIVWKQRNTRKLGPQTLPDTAIFSNAEKLFGFIQKQNEFCQFSHIAADTLAHWPQCRDIFIQRPLKILTLSSQWPLMLNILNFFDRKPSNPIYLRQLAIPNVDTKFIESNKSLINDFLFSILPKEAINSNIEGLSRNGFEQRFGFRYDEPLIRFRILDPSHFINGLSDITLPLSQFCDLSLAIDTVFITENKINGLAFPAVKDAIVIFGLGYGLSSLSNATWLEGKTIVYWGDIDTHGFIMLDHIRQRYPQAQSLLMDQQTLELCQDLWVTESSPTQQAATQLNDQERSVYLALLQHRWAKNLRLEQERIPYLQLLDALQQLDLPVQHHHPI